MKWNKKDLEKAIELVKKGFNYIEIGIQLNITPDSIRNKLTRKGYKFTLLNTGREKKHCVNCNKEFETTKSNEKIFCNHSCAAIFNSKNKIKKERKKCLCCNKELIDNKKDIRQTKFCSYSCQGQYKKTKNFNEIENGNTSLYVKNYRNYLIDKHGAKCMECGWDKINQTTGLVPIQLEHIDGNSDNNKLENLKLLCPNCHSLTTTFGALNKNGRDSKRKKEWRSKFEKKEKKILPEVEKKCKNCNKNFIGKEKRIFCSSDCSKNYSKRNIPSKEDLINSLRDLKYYTKVAKKYNVSNSTIVKWEKKYNIVV